MCRVASENWSFPGFSNALWCIPEPMVFPTPRHFPAQGFLLSAPSLLPTYLLPTQLAIHVNCMYASVNTLGPTQRRHRSGSKCGDVSHPDYISISMLSLLLFFHQLHCSDERALLLASGRTSRRPPMPNGSEFPLAK